MGDVAVSYTTDVEELPLQYEPLYNMSLPLSGTHFCVMPQICVPKRGILEIRANNH